MPARIFDEKSAGKIGVMSASFTAAWKLGDGRIIERKVSGDLNRIVEGGGEEWDLEKIIER